MVPVCGPLPDITSHMEQTIPSTGGVCCDGCSVDSHGRHGVILERPSHTIGLTTAPGIRLRLTPAGCTLPLCFCGQTTTGPATECIGLIPSDGDHRVVLGSPRTPRQAARSSWVVISPHQTRSGPRRIGRPTIALEGLKASSTDFDRVDGKRTQAHRHLGLLIRRPIASTNKIPGRNVDGPGRSSREEK